MVLMPPGAAKSTYTSVLFPPWWLAQHPRSSIIAASHTTDFARRWGRRCRNLIVEHSATLGYSLTPDEQAADRWSTTTGGEYGAFGLGAAVTGRRSDLAIIDDPVKGYEAADSQTQRDAAWEWYLNDFYTRLKPGGRIVLIMTRWNEDDLGGRLLNAATQGGDQWQVLKLPAIAEMGDPLHREIGEPLWPEWEDADALARKRSAVGARTWGALYQQNPQPIEGTLFRLDSFLENGTPLEYPPTCDSVFATIDTATKTGNTRDGTGVSFWAYNRFLARPLILLDWDLIQIDGDLLIEWLPSVFARLTEFAKQCRARFGSIGAYIEDKSSGMILLQQAARLGYPVEPINADLTKLVTVGKTERALNVLRYVETNQVGISKQALERTSVYHGVSKNHWLAQVTGFRVDQNDKAQEDDLLDTMCYGIALACGNVEGF